MQMSREDFRRACEVYHIKILQENGASFLVKASTLPEYDKEEELEFIPWLSLCNYLACQEATIKITNWIWEPSEAYEAEIILPEEAE